MRMQETNNNQANSEEPKEEREVVLEWELDEDYLYYELNHWFKF